MASHKEPDAPKTGRTTVPLFLRVPPDTAAHAETMARRLGLGLSEYVCLLIRGQEPISRPAAEMQDVSLAGNRIVRAIGKLQAAEPDVAAAIGLLRESQRFIATELQKALPEYQRAIAIKTGADDWENSRSS